MRETYGVELPGMDLSNLPGKLIVIEGTDGVGRTTQINLLKPWLEQEGRAVLVTGMTRSTLAGKGIKRAKEGNTLGRLTLSLYYATDFADRLENEIVPALRAGFVVLTDRYIYSLMARALVRGIDPAWVHRLYRFALRPDAIFYLRISLEDLVPRVIFSHGFDYWESGMDLFATEDMYESFCKYQTALMAQFDGLTREYGFQVADASQPVEVIFEQLREEIRKMFKEKPSSAAPRRPPEGNPANVTVNVATEEASREPARIIEMPGAGSPGDSKSTA